jgi:DNA-binding NarL/FixJ family response regulator
LAAIFRSQTDIEVVAEAADGEEACELYDQLSPDVLLLDLRMPKKDALPAIIELMSSPRAPKPRIIVMATYEEEEDIHRTLSAGARGYVLKAGRPEYTPSRSDSRRKRKPAFEWKLGCTQQRAWP